MNTRAKSNIRERRTGRLDKAIESALRAGDIDHADLLGTPPSVDEVRDMLEEAVLLEYRSKQVADLCTWAERQPWFKRPDYTMADKEAGRPRPVDVPRAAMCRSAVAALRRPTAYRFFFIGGVVSQRRTLYAESHEEAWQKAGDYARLDMRGAVRAAFCYAFDGHPDPGTFREMQHLLRPGGEADTFCPGWRDRKS